MKAAIRSSALARIFLVAGFGVALSAMPASAQKAGGSITVGLELDIPGFDPLKVGVYDTSAETAAAAIFDTLVALDDNGKPVPKLALSWTHSDDYKTWTFKLRPGVKFHDGTPFNAQAVKENFDRQKDPANKCRCAFYIAYVNNVQAPDELTVVYNLNDPQVNSACADDDPEFQQCCPLADGMEDQGRRLQPQSRRHRSLYPEVMDRRRPHGAGKESGLLEQGPSLSRPHHAEAVAGCAVALRQPAIGRSRHRLGRRIRRRQHS